MAATGAATGAKPSGSAEAEDSLTLRVLDGELMVARLSELPSWALEFHPPVTSVTRTADEISVVAPVGLVTPEGAVVEGGWRAMVVLGPLDFALIGILAGLASTLANAKVSIFALSTFDTDYILVKEERLQAARDALVAVGHTVI